MVKDHESPKEFDNSENNSGCDLIWISKQPTIIKWMTIAFACYKKCKISFWMDKVLISEGDRHMIPPSYFHNFIVSWHGSGNTLFITITSFTSIKSHLVGCQFIFIRLHNKNENKLSNQYHLSKKMLFKWMKHKI